MLVKMRSFSIWPENYSHEISRGYLSRMTDSGQTETIRQSTWRPTPLTTESYIEPLWRLHRSWTEAEYSLWSMNARIQVSGADDQSRREPSDSWCRRSVEKRAEWFLMQTISRENNWVVSGTAKWCIEMRWKSFASISRSSQKTSSLTEEDGSRRYNYPTASRFDD